MAVPRTLLEGADFADSVARIKAATNASRLDMVIATVKEAITAAPAAFAETGPGSGCRVVLTSAFLGAPATMTVFKELGYEKYELLEMVVTPESESEDVPD